MLANSPEIISNQHGIHEKLFETVQKHVRTRYCKPFAAYSIEAFERADKHRKRAQLPIILDSGCGTGESSYLLAQNFPRHLVVGLDKSASRLQKAARYMTENLIFIRTDIFDFWRQAVEAGWQVDRHYLLYPNPWPKKHDLKRRYHGHPVFPYLLQLGNYFEIRSNWKIYLQEFNAAAPQILEIAPEITEFIPEQFLSNFEKKFHLSRHRLYKSCFSIHNH